MAKQHSITNRTWHNQLSDCSYNVRGQNYESAGVWVQRLESVKMITFPCANVWKWNDIARSGRISVPLLYTPRCNISAYIMSSKERVPASSRGNMWTVNALTWQFSMGQPADQQRGIKRELRRARDLLVGEFLCEICLDNGDMETRTSELVTLNVALSTLSQYPA